ncbi:class I SAM-dependent methyltransferase [Shimia sp. MIT1388]|uniref:class I SAM-dependent methyltransferase n=1 Tax=Shimia sp. MIT1388 TaxID=3096992 RepID=UPI00399A8043
MTRLPIEPKIRDGAVHSPGLFFREWIKSPLSIGAITPSGSDLAAEISRDIQPEDGPVIELGPGTGVFTAAVLQRGVAAENIFAVERNPDLAKALATRLPDLHVACDDAEAVAHLMPFDTPAATVLCGLPLLSMPPEKVAGILRASFAVLKPEGKFRLFTYGVRCPVKKAILEQLGLDAQRVAFVPKNLPPASVYHLQRK